LLAENKKVKWVPEWAGERFTDWLENLWDWPVSRQRYWGIPLPIWECSCGETAVIGSYAELAKKAGLRKEVDFHRPAIDGVSWRCAKCGEQMRRVLDVLDVWFDAGVAAWASLGYPRDKKLFEGLWPAKFELEGPDQFRGWWNSQLITGVLTFGRAPFENVLLHGFALDAKGLKMSKSLGNVVGPEDVVARHGRDVLRMYLLSGAAWEDFAFNWEGAKEVQRVLNIFWNAANFVRSYAPQDVEKEKELSIEDAWIVSRLEALRSLGAEAFEGRRVHEFVNAWRDFVVDDFSRWYIKLVRDRVSPWASGPGKRAAQWVLRSVLEQSCVLLAPVAPFISEQVWHELFGKGSVHLQEWPAASERNEGLEAQMAVAESAVEAVGALRAEKGVKLRWPLRAIRVAPKDARARKALLALGGIVKFLGNAEKVEVLEQLDAGKGLRQGSAGKEFEFGIVELGEPLMEEAFVRELVRFVQEQRKKAGLLVTDKIHLVLKADPESEKLLKQREQALAKGVGAEDVVFSATLTPVGTLEFEGR
ncbi:MAG TPA: class I tRNA ligase family protein, partial [archaeon]|nr:class I tRNA ligase family protein [archaeon]